MTRRSMRTLSLKAAAQRTGLPIERLRRAAVTGEIDYFREASGTGARLRGRIFLLEASLEAWFFAHVSRATPSAEEHAAADAAAEVIADDIDAQLLAQTPAEDRFV